MELRLQLAHGRPRARLEYSYAPTGARAPDEGLGTIQPREYAVLVRCVSWR